MVVIDRLGEAVMITGFVAAMMLLIEYLNVLSAGRWQQILIRRQFSQYLLGALLGAVPGCLGTFTAVALYGHGALSFGALVAAAIATSGDETFVMLALIPQTALTLTGVLFVLGAASGWMADRMMGEHSRLLPRCEALIVHAGEKRLIPTRADLLDQWRNCSAVRGVTVLALGLFAGAIAAGKLGPQEWSWVRVSLLVAAACSLWVAATAPEHFLEEHLWQHVIRRHAPRIFLWTAGALLASEPLEKWLQLGGDGKGQWLLLATAGLVGLIPESGPHLVFVTLYAQGALPFGVLLANSAVQDGHGLLPLLAQSRKAFLAVKAANLAVGLAAGAVALLLKL